MSTKPRWTVTLLQLAEGKPPRVLETRTFRYWSSAEKLALTWLKDGGGAGTFGGDADELAVNVKGTKGAYE